MARVCVPFCIQSVPFKIHADVNITRCVFVFLLEELDVRLPSLAIFVRTLYHPRLGGSHCSAVFLVVSDIVNFGIPVPCCSI